MADFGRLANEISIQYHQEKLSPLLTHKIATANLQSTISNNNPCFAIPNPTGVYIHNSSFKLQKHFPSVSLKKFILPSMYTLL